MTSHTNTEAKVGGEQIVDLSKGRDFASAFIENLENEYPELFTAYQLKKIWQNLYGESNALIISLHTSIAEESRREEREKNPYRVKEYDNECVFIMKSENGKTYEASPIEPLKWHEVGELEYRNFNT